MFRSFAVTVSLLLAVLVLAVACGTSEERKTPYISNVANAPVRPHVEWIDYASLSEQNRAMAERLSVDTPEQAASPHGSAAHGYAAGLMQGWANQCRAGSKVHHFKVGGLRTYQATIEQARKQVEQIGHLREHGPIWKEILRIFEEEGLETEC